MKSVSHMTDAQLVKQARIGSQEAFAQLYHAYVQQLFYFARQRTSSDQDASDIVQATFLAAFVKLGELRNPSSFRSWLFSIAVTKISDIARSSARQQETTDLEQTVSAAQAENPTLDLKKTLSPEEAFEQQEKQSALLSYLNELTPLQKDVLILRYYVGFKPSAIAQLLNQSRTVVYKRLHDATAALRGVLGSQGGSTALADAVAVIASSDTEEDAVARLLHKDAALQKSSADAERLVTPKLQAALSALIVGGSLTGEASSGAEAFLKGLALPASRFAGPRVVSPLRSSLQEPAGKVTVAATVVVVVAAGIVGGRALLTHPTSAPTKPTVVAQQQSTPTKHTDEPSSSVPTGVQDKEKAADAPASPATENKPSASLSQNTVPQQSTPKTSHASSTKQKPLVQPSREEPEQPVARPTLTVAHAKLTYSLGTEITAKQLIDDSGTAAHDGAGTALTITVTGIENINTEHAGSYLVFMNAPGAALQTVEVTLRDN